MSRTLKTIGWLSLSLALLGLCRVTDAAITLNDRNSTVNVNEASDPTTGTDNGVVDWIIDGQDQLFQQWFWFRIDNVDAFNDREYGVNELTLLAATATDTNPVFDTDVDTLVLAYGDGATVGTSSFVIQISMMLTGGSAGSGSSDIAETITVFNQSAGAFAFQFFQYSDFDIGDTALGDTAWYEGSHGRVDVADPTASLSETVVTPNPTRGELAFFNTTIANLTDGDVDELAAGDPDGFSHEPFQNNGDKIGPGDVTWAYQWTTVINANGSFQISKDKNITGEPPDRGPFVPEPASLAIWGGLSVLGLVIGGRLRRKAA